MRIAEEGQIVSGFVPVDMQAAANNGDWVNMKEYNHLTVILFKAAGTAGDCSISSSTQPGSVAGRFWRNTIRRVFGKGKPLRMALP